MQLTFNVRRPIEASPDTRVAKGQIGFLFAQRVRGKGVPVISRDDAVHAGRFRSKAHRVIQRSYLSRCSGWRNYVDRGDSDRQRDPGVAAESDVCLVDSWKL